MSSNRNGKMYLMCYVIIINCFQTISSYKVFIKIYKYKLESFKRTPLSQYGPFSGVSLSGEQKSNVLKNNA